MTVPHFIKVNGCVNPSLQIVFKKKKIFITLTALVSLHIRVGVGQRIQLHIAPPPPPPENSIRGSHGAPFFLVKVLDIE